MVGAGSYLQSAREVLQPTAEEPSAELTLTVQPFNVERRFKKTARFNRVQFFRIKDGAFKTIIDHEIVSARDDLS